MKKISTNSFLFCFVSQVCFGVFFVVVLVLKSYSLKFRYGFEHCPMLLIEKTPKTANVLNLVCFNLIEKTFCELCFS